jgi:ABC-type Na+ transport system ATPase subunit NatA
VADARNSTALSRLLLANRSGTTPFRYGAYVPDDVVLPRFSPSMCLAGVPSQQGAAAGLALLAAAISSGEALPTGATVGMSALAGVSALRSAQQLAEPPVNILHNTSSSHALPIFLHELRAAQLRALGGPELSVASHPLPLTAEEVTTLATFLKLLASFFVLIPFSYLPATYAAFVVRERAAGAKLLQLASGCGSVAYWTSAFAWEMLNHTAVTLLCLILFGAFQIDVLVGSWDKGLGAFLLLWLYGFAVIPLSFCYSFLFDSNASAQVAIACANFVTGFCLVNASFIMSITPCAFACLHARAAHKPCSDTLSPPTATVALNARLVLLFRIFPAFCLGEGLIALATSSFDFSSVSDARSEAASGNSTYTTADGAAPSNSFGDFSTSATKTAFRWEVLGRPLILLCAECALYFAATLLIELCGKRAAATVSAALEVPMQRVHALAARFRPAAAALATKRELAPDPEVTAERERMQASAREGASADDVVQVRGLRKVFPARGAAPVKVAVQDLWLSLKAGDRFGLLGANGAGKCVLLVLRLPAHRLRIASRQRSAARRTTTLSILCCDVAPSAGDALVGGASVVRAPRQVQRHIGFCPQYDPLLDLLTVREHLHLYARLKGMPERHVAASAEATWRRVGLGPFADRLAGVLSGGNKRKLSLAIAIIGAPAVLLCDEPRCGCRAAAVHSTIAP